MAEAFNKAWMVLKSDEDNHPMKEYFYMTARASGIPEHEIDEAWKETLNWKPPISNPDPEPETHPGEGYDNVVTRVGRKSGPNPTSAGLRRTTLSGDKNQGSFRDAPFNEETGFTKAIDIAMQLFKAPRMVLDGMEDEPKLCPCGNGKKAKECCESENKLAAGNC